MLHQKAEAALVLKTLILSSFPGCRAIDTQSSRLLEDHVLSCIEQREIFIKVLVTPGLLLYKETSTNSHYFITWSLLSPPAEDCKSTFHTWIPKRLLKFPSKRSIGHILSICTTIQITANFFFFL